MNIEEQKKFTKPPQSYWMASTPNLKYPSLQEDLKVDVAIIGGGITGISCAYFLNRKGIKAAIIEADHILQGTTGHTTAKITSQHGLIYNKIKSQMSEELAKQYADANESAIGMIKKIADENNIDCDYTSQSAYVYTLQDGYVDKISNEAKTAASLGIKAAYLEEIPLQVPIKAAVRFDNQAQFHPRKFLLPIAEKITNSGSQIFEQSRIVDIEEGSSYVLITEQGKRITAGKVIIASHYPCYNKPGLYFTRIYSERSYVVAVKASVRYPGGMYITAEDPGRSLRSQMSDDGELIFVGGEHHKTGQGEDTVKHYEVLVDYANQNFAVEDIPYRWSTQDCMTLDDVPYVGHFTSKTPNMYIATGYGKWGMTSSIASAMLLSDLIVDGESPCRMFITPRVKP
jgi:glycine/D-amino acid oxidase-like deaminating enzyme